MAFWLLLATLLPPNAVGSPQATLGQLAAAGIVVHGRDPLDGSGLCGPLLPVVSPGDVSGVTLPKCWSLDDLELLRMLPNLDFLQCDREIYAWEYVAIRKRTSFHAQILCKVWCLDGKLRFATNALVTKPQFDQNGDGVLTDADFHR